MMMVMIKFYHYQNVLQSKSRRLKQRLIGKISQNRKMTLHMTSYVQNEAWYEKYI